MYAVPQKVLIDGVVYFDRQQDIARRAEIEKEKQELAEKGKEKKEKKALALVTINPAIQLLIDDRVGSLEAGKDADIVLWENYPLSSFFFLPFSVSSFFSFSISVRRAMSCWRSK